MRSKRLPGLPVLSIASGTQLGRVRQPLIDPGARKVAGLTLSASRLGGRKVLPMEAIHAMGSHAVTVTQPDALKSTRDESVASLMSHQSVKVIGSPAITVQGIMVGTVQDYQIAEDGLIDSLFLSQTLWKTLANGEINVSGDMIIALGSDAVIVTNEVESLKPVERSTRSTPTKSPAKLFPWKPKAKRE